MNINIKKIESLKPCQNKLDNFKNYYPTFKGNHRKFFALENITHSDKIWVAVKLLSRLNAEIFALDCAVSAQNYAAAANAAADAVAYAADPAADAAYTAAVNAAADAAAYAAYAAAYAADASDPAAYAAAANAAAYAAYTAANAAADARKKEQDSQIEVLCYLLENK